MSQEEKELIEDGTPILDLDDASDKSEEDDDEDFDDEDEDDEDED